VLRQAVEQREPVRRQGIARALVAALLALARERGCYGMFVFADEDNVAAHATYASAGAHEASRPIMLEWEVRTTPAGHA